MNNKQSRIEFRVTPDLKAKVEALAQEKKKPLSKVLRELLMNEIENRKAVAA